MPDTEFRFYSKEAIKNSKPDSKTVQDAFFKLIRNEAMGSKFTSEDSILYACKQYEEAKDEITKPSSDPQKKAPTEEEIAEAILAKKTPENKGGYGKQKAPKIEDFSQVMTARRNTLLVPQDLKKIKGLEGNGHVKMKRRGTSAIPQNMVKKIGDIARDIDIDSEFDYGYDQYDGYDDYQYGSFGDDDVFDGFEQNSITENRPYYRHNEPLRIHLHGHNGYNSDGINGLMIIGLIGGVGTLFLCICIALLFGGIVGYFTTKKVSKTRAKYGRIVCETEPDENV